RVVPRSPRPCRRAGPRPVCIWGRPARAAPSRPGGSHPPPPACEPAWHCPQPGKPPTHWGRVRTAEPLRSRSLAGSGANDALFLAQPSTEPHSVLEALLQTGEEVSHHMVCTVPFHGTLEVEELLGHQERTQRLRSIQHCLSQSARLVGLALGNEQPDQDELPEGPAACPVAWSQRYDPLCLSPGFAEVSELMHAASGFAGEGAFVERAHPLRGLLG